MSVDSNGAAGADDIPGTENGQPKAQPVPNVQLDTSQLKSTYCNVCNATSTREEVVLNFGLNQNWDRQAGDSMVQLHHRIILSPFAAKRLQDILGQLIGEHEKRYGPLE